MYIESEHIRINFSILATKIINQDFTIFGSFTTKTENGFINDIISSYLDSYEDHKLNAALTKIKGPSKEYRLSRGNIENLNELFERESYDEYKTTSLFIKTIIETYVRLPFIQRERIILRLLIDEIEKAINRGKMLRIKTFRQDWVELSPYKIVPSRENSFSYLIGFLPDGEVKSIRLSQIITVKLFGVRKLPDDYALNDIDDQIAEFGATFIDDKPTKIIIQFLTDEALDSYKYSIIQRPIHTKILDTEKRILQFNCSMKQAKYFFFRFAGDIKILEPTELRDWMLDKYRSGIIANE